MEHFYSDNLKSKMMMNEKTLLMLYLRMKTRKKPSTTSDQSFNRFLKVVGVGVVHEIFLNFTQIKFAD